MRLYRCYRINSNGEKEYLNDKWYHAKNHAKSAVTCRENCWSYVCEHEQWYMEEYEPVLIEVVDEFSRQTKIIRRR